MPFCETSKKYHSNPASIWRMRRASRHPCDQAQHEQGRRVEASGVRPRSGLNGGVMQPTLAVFAQLVRCLNLQKSALLLLLLAAPTSTAFAGESPYKPPITRYYCTSNPASNTRYYS